MCGVIVAIFCIAFAIYVTFVGYAAIAGIILVLIFLATLGNYFRAKSMTATPMICPNCKSRNVFIKSQVDGVAHSGFSASNFSSNNVGVSRSHICYCKDCGFDFAYITQQEVDKAISDSKNGIIGSLLLLVLYSLLITYLRIALSGNH